MHSFIFDVKSTVENPSFTHYAVQATAASVSQYFFAPNVRRAFSKLVVFAFLAFLQLPIFLASGFALVYAAYFWAASRHTCALHPWGV
jgi:hypothetical protein